MSTELTNLLPRERARALTREYFFRLATVALTVCAALVFAHAILLWPTYQYLSGEQTTRAAHLEQLTAALAASAREDTNARVSQLDKDATYLARLDAMPTGSAPLRALLAVPHAGVSLTGFTVTPETKTSPGRMTVKGVASTREALRQYVQSLTGLSFVSNVDLPISAYAKETEIDFTVTLTGSLRP